MEKIAKERRGIFSFRGRCSVLTAKIREDPSEKTVSKQRLERGEFCVIWRKRT